MKTSLALLLLLAPVPTIGRASPLDAYPVVVQGPAGAKIVDVGGRRPYVLVEPPLAMVADHLLVKMKPGADVDAFAAHHGAIVRRRLPHGLHLLSFPLGPIADRVAQGEAGLAHRIAAWHADPAVARVEPNFIRFCQATPNDPSYAQQWGMARIGAPAAWDLGTDAAGVPVGLIDTGLDVAHPDLAANVWTNPGEIAGNGIDDDGNGYVDDARGWDFFSGDNVADEAYPHGSHCAGIIGARGDNAIGVAGVCWSAAIVPLKIGGADGTIDDALAIEALAYTLDKGIRISSNSWGGPGFSQSLYDAIAEAGTAGALFVAASGNAAVDSDVVPLYPAAYDLPNIISVAASTSGDALSPFSNWGLTTVDLAAPGSAIYSTYPGGTYASWSGTSMAAPHVAGACALMWTRFPDQDAAWIKARLMNTVTPIASMSSKLASGGRLNLAAAMTISPPALTITSPAVDQVLLGGPVTVTGTATDNGMVAEVRWTNAADGSTGVATGTSSWTASVPLLPGVNQVDITATDTAGDAATESRTFTVLDAFTMGPVAIARAATARQADSIDTTVTILNPSSVPQPWSVAPGATGWCAVTSLSSGTVAPGAHAFFTVRIDPTTLDTGAYADALAVTLGPLVATLQVHVSVAPPPAESGGGCSAGEGGDLAPVVLVLLVLAVARRGRYP